ncbi:uncharacterized protein Dana_GF11628 [Drosophila ananassae]|uniref:Uncharacterized protein n=1 Tax=Drosophila ananassae TaxID=7217 RepID=B3MIY3_DROAN|nr:uncharacterized protein LOC6494492 [Drosophila ananassae]EDV37049.1 uncharacterized protein Dana_GF11628 [Drosophila ananassae]KAH8316483.1 hypothetical protein KR067_009091 [Drosophila pandora]
MSVPQYQPPKEIQDLLDKKEQQQINQRRRTAVLPKRSWIKRNPRLFQITFLTGSLLIFFSKPLYDCFIADPLPPPEVKVPPHKR